LEENTVFLGHYGIALGVKRFAPRTSLGALVLAAQLPDEIWPILLLTGGEKVAIVPDRPATLRLAFVSYPITHSLLMEVVGGLLLGLLYYALRKDRRGALFLAMLVPSHWVLDFLVHVPDLPLWPGGPRVGLGLWQSLPATLALEAFFFGAGLLYYLRATRPRNKSGTYGLWVFVLLLLAGYVSSLAGSAPRDVHALAYTVVSLWLFPALAYWIDLKRSASNGQL
jgi:hypothetical protein